MQLAIVLGSTHATIKHQSLVGQRLVVLQPIGVGDTADGPPLIALDQLGSRRGDKVMVTSDSSYAREACNDDHTPARWTVIGLIDE